MAEIATYAELRAWGNRPEARTFFEKAFGLPGKNVFLSHTTADDDLVAGVVWVLEAHGARVYVDHQDPSVAGTDCVAIAEHLRKVMSQCSRLVMLASPKSKDSKWIPWELGLGDGLTRQNRVALFPSAESSSEMTWSEREYLGLYQRIVWERFRGQSNDQWMVRLGAAILTELNNGCAVAVSFRIKTEFGVLTFRLPANIDGVFAVMQRSRAIPAKLGICER